MEIGTASASDLDIGGTAIPSGTIGISNSLQTLEIGPSGYLTIAAAESITLGQILLDGGTFADGGELTIGSGKLTGTGTVTASLLAGTGLVEATGGTLDLTGPIAADATDMQIAGRPRCGSMERLARARRSPSTAPPPGSWNSPAPFPRSAAASSTGSTARSRA